MLVPDDVLGPEVLWGVELLSVDDEDVACCASVPIPAGEAEVDTLGWWWW